MQAPIYLGIMPAVIIVWFLIFKRPVYEADSPRFFCARSGEVRAGPAAFS